MPRPVGRPRKALKIENLPMQDWFTVAEAAALTGWHIHTIQARLRDGSLRGKKLGGIWKIYRDSLLNDKVDVDPNIEKRDSE